MQIRHVKQRKMEPLHKKYPIHIRFDALDFHWENVPKKKYENFLKMQCIEADPANFIVDGYPYMLQVEPTNICNLKCPLCPAGTNLLQRERRHLLPDEFKKLIDDMEEYLLFLILWEWGEPFMHPSLPEMIRYASDRDIKTLTSTNAHFLDNDDYLKEILTSGLTALIIAIDSLEQEKYEIYRQNGKLSKAVEGLKNIVRLKKKLKSDTRINLRMVIMKQNENELEEIRSFAKKMGVDVFSVKTLNPSCGLDSKDDNLVPMNPFYRRYNYHGNTYERIREDKHCRKMWFMCNISANGDVIPCGYDYTCQLKVGNILEKPLTLIWNDPESQKMRKMLYYDKESIPKCRECSINFQLSEGGWFPEIICFDEPRMDRFFRRAYESYKKNSIAQNVANRFPVLKRGARRLLSNYIE